MPAPTIGEPPELPTFPSAPGQPHQPGVFIPMFLAFLAWFTAFRAYLIELVAYLEGLGGSSSGGGPALSLNLAVETVVETTYVFVLGDAHKHKRFTNAAAVAVTVPQDFDVPFPIGTRIRCTAAGDGATTLVPGPGVTLNSRDGALTSTGQYAVWEIEKVDTDAWDVLGDLVA